VARLRVTAGWEAAWERGLAAVRQGVLILLPYALLLLLAPGWVLAHLYAGSAYAGLETPLRLLVVGSLLLYLAHTGSAVLYGLGLASAALVVQFAGTGALLLCGLPLTAAWGLNGAALATVAIHGGRLLACARATHPARRYPAPFTGEGAG
jgi:O-antigen/teichoic acid export membrane protein